MLFWIFPSYLKFVLQFSSIEFVLHMLNRMTMDFVLIVINIEVTGVAKPYDANVLCCFCVDLTKAF